MSEHELGRGFLGRSSLVRIGGTYDFVGVLPDDAETGKECYVEVEGEERVTEPWEDASFLPIADSIGFNAAEGKYGRLVFIAEEEDA